MPQKTNLNINPYYDDYNPNSSFYKVLFKPGFPIQARELTTLQSILQNQVESFGSHIFKEGSMVIPGNVTYDGQYYAVQLNTAHLGVDVSLYADKLVGKVIRGQTSGVSAVVLPAGRNDTTIKGYLSETESDTGNLTIYVNYIDSDGNGEYSTFLNNEVLIVQENVTFGATTIAAGDTIASLISENATSIGSAASVGEGVYFIRGSFVRVSPQTIILDQFDSFPTYRVGLNINEEIISAGDIGGESLYDNARGFSNYAAPGADRLKITTTLIKKSIDDFNDTNFVEILRVQNGDIKIIKTQTEYNILRNYFAQRTYDESGDYSVIPFEVSVNNSLNDRLGNGGLFFSNQKTDEGNDPDDGLMCVKVSPGKAYVRGFDIEKLGTTIIDTPKPRDTKTVDNSLVSFGRGNLLRVNNTSGSPVISINTNNIIYLQNQRKSSFTQSSGAGTTIGSARVYSFGVTNAGFTTFSTSWDLYLYDIQTYSKIELNTPVNSYEVPETSLVRGQSSNASGYVVNSVGIGSSTITLYQTSGQFMIGEKLSFNGTNEVSRSVKKIVDYGIQDIKSVYQDTSTFSGFSAVADFSADLVLDRKLASGFNITDQITINNAGIVTSNGRNFVGIKSDAIIRYQTSGAVGFSTETFNRVVSVSPDGLSMTVAAVNSVSGVCSGSLPLTNVTSTFSLGVPSIGNANQSGLYAPADARNLVTVDLTGSNISIIRQITGLSVSATGELVVTTAAITDLTNIVFEVFDESRYTITYSDGAIEPLTEDKFTLSSNGTQITFNGLRASQSNVVLSATIKKYSVQNKVKNYIRSEKLIINKSKYTYSGIGTNNNDGLTYNKFYGLRVHDEEISLNVPDVVKLVAVYQSLNTSAPTFDKLNFETGLNLDNASIIGEYILGAVSGAIAQLVTRSSSTQIEIVYVNSESFIIGEKVRFQESGILGTIQSLTKGNFINITNKYTLDKGQKDQYYDYSRIVRTPGATEPSRTLTIVYDKYQVPSNDTGDIYTVASYANERFANDIPSVSNNLRISDTLDFRPKVSDFALTTRSPFAFDSRNFSSAGTNPTVVMAPNESSIIGYSYYLPRIDKVVLGKNGQFSVIKGVSSDNPKPPLNVEEAMDIATINLPAFLYSPSDAKISLIDNRRYTMRDIGDLDTRITNLETVTTLSLLEVDTKTLQIQDADGLSRFKSGFFVDNFRNRDLLDQSNFDLKCDIDPVNNQMVSPNIVNTIKTQIAFASTVAESVIDLSSNSPLLDSNVRKTGPIVTLNYQEEEWIGQPLASRVENINPFSVVSWVGSVKLNPAVDNWVRTIQLEGGTSTRFTGIGGASGAQTTNTLVSSVSEQFMRSRNVEFIVNNLKPYTRYYGFLDGNGGLDYVPKLLEVGMTNGSPAFQTGETVTGSITAQDGTNVRLIRFRVAAPNHKTGAYNNSVLVYNANPYDKNVAITTAYTASSTLLNVDTFSLSEEAQGQYSGYVVIGTTLKGETSGAQATVSNIRLTTDNFGDIHGTFFIRDPLASPPPAVRIETGNKTFRITSSSTNKTPLPGSLLISSGETSYTSTGIVNTFIRSTVILLPYDPLAQSFTVDGDGAFVSSVDLYLANKDDSLPLTIELRPVELGTPTGRLVSDLATVTVQPNQINVSDNANAVTNVKFKAPIFLEPNKEYAIVLRSDSDQYEAWIARMGEKTIEGQILPNVQGVVVSQQFAMGSLFKSQNGTIWTASQYDDLKFKLYRCAFTSSAGSAYFYNPNLDETNAYLPKLNSNPIRTLPRKVKVGITSSISLNTTLTIGTKVSASNAITGIIESVGGSIKPITGITTTNPGYGYSSGTYTNVSLYPILSSGSGATATVSFHNSGITTVSIANTGNGYSVGDVLGVTTAHVSRGFGARISVRETANIDTLFLTNVTGEKFISGQNVLYYDSSNTLISLGATATYRGDSALTNNTFAGNVFEINDYNHGMSADNNVIKITGVEPNVTPTTLSSALQSTSTVISVASTTDFSIFEGITTSRGYVKVNDEIIYYTSIGSGTLGISTRGISGTTQSQHAIGSFVYKYELNGVSLTKINRTHNMATTNDLNQARDQNKYYLEFDREDRASGATQINFADEKFLGGNNVYASRNMQFNSVTPQYRIFTPGKNTTVNGKIRTVSGTSAGGNEVSFIDQGFEDVEINQVNNLESTRLVCSKINETERLTSLPRNKSLTVAISLFSTNKYLSPYIDLDVSHVELIRNSINNPVSNYTNESASSLLIGDPHSMIYFSNRVNLKQPATSLKVLVSSYRHSTADFRVLYRLFRPDSSEITQSYVLFPGYSNLTDTNGDGFGDKVIDASSNDGKPDAFVRASDDNEFLEYQFTSDNLEQFTGFIIKIVASGTNEAYAPRFKDLRAIALA